jgi:hypothetical protein
MNASASEKMLIDWCPNISIGKRLVIERSPVSHAADFVGFFPGGVS